MIDRLFPGEGYLVLIYKDGTLDLARDGEVNASWHKLLSSSLGEAYRSKNIGKVYPSGLFVLVHLRVSGELFCVPLHNKGEGSLQCEINSGHLVLPKTWTGVAGVSCGHNHCVVHAINDTKPEGRAYVAGSNSNFQLGHGGVSCGVLKVVRPLCARNVTAIFSAGNMWFALDKAGRLVSFGGEKKEQTINRDGTVNRDGNFQDVAVAETVQYAMVEEDDGHFGLVKIEGTVSSPIQVDGKITSFKVNENRRGPRWRQSFHEE